MQPCRPDNLSPWFQICNEMDGGCVFRSLYVSVICGLLLLTQTEETHLFNYFTPHGYHLLSWVIVDELMNYWAILDLPKSHTPCVSSRACILHILFHCFFLSLSPGIFLCSMCSRGCTTAKLHVFLTQMNCLSQFIQCEHVSVCY